MEKVNEINKFIELYNKAPEEMKKAIYLFMKNGEKIEEMIDMTGLAIDEIKKHIVDAIDREDHFMTLILAYQLIIEEEKLNKNQEQEN